MQIIDVTNPVHPTPVSAVFDDSGGFSALYVANDVAVFEQENRIYAVVAARYDDGVQIIDVTNPVHPTPASAVFDDSGGFSALGGANDVAVFEQGSRIYAVVAARDHDDGVQIIDVTNPVHPTPASAVFDDSGGFSALGGAVDVAIFEQGNRIYAVVTAFDDDGVQIIDVTQLVPSNLDITAEITSYERTHHGGNDFVQVTVLITNNEFTTLINDNQNGYVRFGELHTSLNALAGQYTHIDTMHTCDEAGGHCVWSNGRYIAYNDMTRSQAEDRGIAVTENDCTAWDDWSIPRGDEMEVRFCYWVHAGFEPESIQFYRASTDRLQTIPFSAYGSCYLPAMQCNEAALVSLQVFTATVYTTDPINDKFSSDLEGWSYYEKPNLDAIQQHCGGVQNTDVYSLSQSQEHGGSALVSEKGVCWFGLVGAIKVFTIPSNYSNVEMLLSLDYRSLAATGASTVNNILYAVYDSSDNIIQLAWMFPTQKNSGILDTGWRSYITTVSPMSASQCPCKLAILTEDGWVADWRQSIYFDNVVFTLFRD